MQTWHRSWKADLGIRAAGLLSSALAQAAIARLMTAHLHGAAGPRACCLAAIGFLCASAGAAMVLLGRHLFDRIEVSSRWRPRCRGWAGTIPRP